MRASGEEGPGAGARPLRLQPLVRGRVASLGEPGARWLQELPTVLDALEQRWRLELDRTGLPGGSASWVGGARTHDGRARVLKVGVPGHDLTSEARVLDLAGGRGLARLHAHDHARNALLLERLGPSLATTSLPVTEQLDHLAAALAEVWALPVAGLPRPGPGGDKASDLRRLVIRTDARLGRPCPPRVRELALEYAGRRADAHDPGRCVLVHGDPHPANALRVPDPDPGGLAYRLVDPDGFLADPAYDLGVVLREWTGALGPHPRARLEEWCRHLAGRTGLEAHVIWEWAYLERVSTALHVLDIGAETLGRRLLDSAARLT